MENQRRDFMKKSMAGTFALTAGLTGATTLLSSFSEKAITIADLDTPTAANEKEFRMKVIGPAELSLVTSQLAVSQATNRFAKEFAGFEMTEAIAVTGVLKDLGTRSPGMDAKAKATLAKIKGAQTGADFDKAYITAQKENHEFLRDLAQDYINKGKLPGAAENQTRHLATLALAVFKEHVQITTDILNTLNG